MISGIDPFATLGLNAATATVEDVNASFRRLALAHHPDKNPEDPEAAAKEFVKLKSARERAIARLENPHSLLEDGASNEVATVDPMVNWALIWMHRMTYEIAKSKEAKPVEVDLEVSLEDVLHARIKKVVLGVLRADSGEPFKRTRQTVFVRLLPKLMEDGTISLDAIFPAMGDDPPLAILLGFDVWKDMIDVDTLPPRSDVIVRVHVKPHEVYSIDTVLRGCDLHATLNVSLEGRYLGERFELPHPALDPSQTLPVDYLPSEENERQVRVFKGMGLPYDSGKSGNRDQGDLYVIMEPKLPPTVELDDPRVREALALLGPRKKGFPTV